MNQPWHCYTIYDHPDDHPGHVVLREFMLEKGSVIPTGKFWLCLSVEQARGLVPGGLACFQRDPEDLPSVVETWL